MSDLIDYAEFVELAQELIDGSGRSVKVQQLSGAIADAAKPWNGPGAPTVLTERTLIATFLELFSFIKLGVEIIDEDLLKRTEKVVMIAPLDIDISEFHLIEDDGVIWKIEWARVLKPGPTLLLYWFGVKR